MPDAAIDNLNVVPRYRTSGKEWVAVNGIPSPPGTEFEAKYWPMWPLTTLPRLEAVNEPARRIMAYIDKFRMGYPVVDHLWSEQYDRYWLPEPADDYRSAMVRVVAEENVLPGMPQYRSLAKFNDGPLVPDRPFPHRVVKVGDIITVLTWPARLSHHEFEPANREGELVWDYFERNKTHPALEQSPWCWFHRAIFLPDLPSVRRQEAA
jgi:hypothetical protein